MKESDKNKSVSSSEETNDNQDARRKLIQSLAAGGIISSAALVPGKWSKPAVNALVIPAHANMSSTPLNGSAVEVAAASSGGVTQQINPDSDQLLAQKVLDIFVEPAEAHAMGLLDCDSIGQHCFQFSFTGDGQTVNVTAQLVNHGAVMAPSVELVDATTLPQAYVLAGNGNNIEISGSFAFNGLQVISGSGTIDNVNGNCVGLTWNIDDECGKHPTPTTTSTHTYGPTPTCAPSVTCTLPPK